MTAIRDITENDWRMLRAIRLRALQDAPDAFTSDYGDEAGHDEHQWRERVRGNLWLLAFQDGIAAAPIGVIAVTREPLVPAGDPFLNSLWVDPGHRRHGIARGLLQAAADLMAARGAEAVSLWVLDSNKAAHRLYAAAGFVHTEDRQLAPGSSGMHERRMRRSLRLGRRGQRAGRCRAQAPGLPAHRAGRPTAIT